MSWDVVTAVHSARAKRWLPGLSIVSGFVITALIMGVATPISAQDLAAQNAPRAPINHTVIEGETLQGLAKRYFGDASRWVDIHRLNERIANPDVLPIGLRIRVPYPPAMPVDSALLTRQAKRVEERISPRTWTNAENHDVLRQNDALRTFEEASAELSFADDTNLLVTENSLVIVGLNAPVRRSAPSELAVEVVVGQADLQRTAAADGVPSTSTSTLAGRDIEIVIGDAAARPMPGPDGAVQARARKPEAGGAMLMMYAGDSVLEAEGATVALTEGTGSVVAEGAAPGPPEILLPAPTTEAPAPGGRIANPRPTLQWQVVADAAAYTVEVCADGDCAALVVRTTGLTDTSWQASTLPIADLFWRVTAVSASGLDGYPSPPSALTITADREDQNGPTVVIRLEGERVQAPRFGLNTVPIAGLGTRLTADIDDPSGVARTTMMLDGEETTPDTWRGPWASGPHSVTVVAVDNAGNERVSAPFDFVYDPDPPVFRWGIQGDPALGQMAGKDRDVATPLPAFQGWRRWPTEGRQRRGAWRVASDGAQVRLWPDGNKAVQLVGIETRIERDRGLWVLAEDALCPGPPTRLVYGLRNQSTTGRRGRAVVLTVEATDCAGNTSRMAWPLNTR